MNLVITLSQIKHLAQTGSSSEYFFFFMERKPNIIMDGFFTKISVSTSFFTMNGLFLTFGIREKHTDDVYTNDTVSSLQNGYDNKYYIYFDPYTIENRYTTECVIQLEEIILKMYGSTIPSKTPVYSLKTQLQGGTFKIHREQSNEMQGKYILKISGVWESAHSYGVTYKCTVYS
jgi:hypothetical protein